MTSRVKMVCVVFLLCFIVSAASPFLFKTTVSAKEVSPSLHASHAISRSALLCQNSFFEFEIRQNFTEDFSCSGYQPVYSAPNTLYGYYAHGWSGVATVMYEDGNGDYTSYDVDFCNNDVAVFGSHGYWLLQLYLSPVKEPWCR